MPKRIYEISLSLPAKSTRLVKAASTNGAIRHVADSIITAKVATQDALVTLLAAGVKVEEASEEPAKAIASEPIGTNGLEAKTPSEPITSRDPDEIPEHLRRVPRIA